MMAHLEEMPPAASDSANRTSKNKTEANVADGGHDILRFVHFRLE